MNTITLEMDWLVLKKVTVNGIEALSIIRKKMAKSTNSNLGFTWKYGRIQ